MCRNGVGRDEAEDIGSAYKDFKWPKWHQDAFFPSGEPAKIKIPLLLAKWNKMHFFRIPILLLKGDNHKQASEAL